MPAPENVKWYFQFLIHSAFAQLAVDIDQNLQRHRTVSLRQHDFLVNFWLRVLDWADRTASFWSPRWTLSIVSCVWVTQIHKQQLIAEITRQSKLQYSKGLNTLRAVHTKFDHVLRKYERTSISNGSIFDSERSIPILLQFIIFITRKPSYRWQTHATWKSAKNCSNSTCLNVVADDTGLSSFVYICCCVRNLRNPAKFTNNSNLWSSRSSKVIDLGVNGKPICDFILVINSNFSRICYRFRDIHG